jgi:site-specific recombinase XerD
MNTVKVRRLRLSEIAKRYLEEVTPKRKEYFFQRTNMTLKYFEYWINDKQLKLPEINKLKIDAFEEDLAEIAGLRLGTRHAMRIVLQRYFIWLHKNQHISKEINEIFPRFSKRQKRTNIDLPQEALSFLEFIQTRSKTGTVKSYTTHLKIFYEFLKNKKIDLRCIARLDIEKYLTTLPARFGANSSRRHAISSVRTYLIWLNDCNMLKIQAKHLIKQTDMPKDAKFLPRFIPHEIDINIQKRLKESDNILHDGLLLMRRTGIRIGELTDLKFDCLKTNLNNHSFLKVELGKLYTERMVPLHDDTVKLIHKITASPYFRNA